MSIIHVKIFHNNEDFTQWQRESSPEVLTIVPILDNLTSRIRMFVTYTKDQDAVSINDLQLENEELKRLLFEVTHSEERKKITEPLWVPIIQEYSRNKLKELGA